MAIAAWSMVKHFFEFLSVLKPAAIRGQGEVDLEQVTLEDVKGVFDHVSLKRTNVKGEGVFSVHRAQYAHVREGIIHWQRSRSTRVPCKDQMYVERVLESPLVSLSP